MTDLYKLAAMLGEYADRRDGELLFFVLCDRGIDPLSFDPDEISEELWQSICEEVEECRRCEDEYEQSKPYRPMEL